MQSIINNLYRIWADTNVKVIQRNLKDSSTFYTYFSNSKYMYVKNVFSYNERLAKLSVIVGKLQSFAAIWSQWPSEILRFLK